MIGPVARPEGIARLGRDHPDVTGYAAAIKRGLNARGLNGRGVFPPGLGDVGGHEYRTE
jgi:uracil phosphoribosyltransferase